MTEWPVAVAPDSVDELADRIAARRGRIVILEGPTGIGKSALASAVVAELAARGFEVLAASALPALRDVPFGALAPILPAHGDEPAEERLRRLLERLSRASARAVLRVEDADALDALSAATVHQLVRVYGTRVLLTTRRADALAEPILRLEDEGLAERVAVPGLAPDVAAALVETAVGGRVDPESLSVLVARADGNPLFLRLLLREADREGLVAPGPRGAVIAAPALPERVAQLLSEPIDAISDRTRAWLERIAVAGALPAASVDARPLARLVRRGLVARGDGLARVVSPLVAEATIARLTPEAVDARRREAAELLSARGTDEDRFTAVVLLAETPSPPSTADLVWAAHHATNHDRYVVASALAERAHALARERGEAVPIDALIVRAECLSLLRRAEEADRAFRDLLDADADDAGLALAAARAGVHWAIRRHDPRGAVEIASTALARLADPEARAFLTTNIAKWRLMIGDARETPGEPGPLSGSPVVRAAAALDAAVYRLIAAIFAGDLDAARAAIADGRTHASASRSIIRHGAQLLEFGEFLVLVLDGRVGEALGFADEHAGDRFDEGAGMWRYGVALAQYHAGLVEEADRNAADAVDLLAWRDFLGARGAALALRATTAGRLADEGAAGAALEELVPPLLRVVTAALQSAEARAWTLVRAGEPDAAAAVVRDAVTASASAGYAGWSAFTAHAAVRFGRPEAVVEPLRVAAERSPARFVRLVLDHAEALLAEDPSRVLAAAEALDSAGFAAGAYDAARQAVAVAGAAGATALARRARTLASRVETRLSPAPATAGALSAREREIAAAAASRRRNREIADDLGLSLRTVENHLAHVYRKLGVASRDELRAHLG